MLYRHLPQPTCFPLNYALKQKQTRNISLGHNHKVFCSSSMEVFSKQINVLS